MLSHLTVGSNDLSRSRAFYDALFAATGGKAGVDDPLGRVVYRDRGMALLLTTPIDGQPATAGNGITIGFGLESPAAIDAWHAAGLAHGGAAAEDPPGVRDAGFARLYLAYLRDPDGNKLCALYRMPD